MKREMTCIVCPIGCRLTVDGEGDAITVTGNGCPRGAKYAKSELTHPVRTLTTTVRIESKALAMLPVRTDRPIPKDRMAEGMALAATIVAKAPVKTGDVLYPDFIEEGTALIACRDVPN